MKTVNDRGSYSKTVRCIMSDAGAKGRRILLMSAAVMTVTKLMLAYAPLLAGKITDELAASMDRAPSIRGISGFSARCWRCCSCWGTARTASSTAEWSGYPSH